MHKLQVLTGTRILTFEFYRIYMVVSNITGKNTAMDFLNNFYTSKVTQNVMWKQKIKLFLIDDRTYPWQVKNKNKIIESQTFLTAF